MIPKNRKPTHPGEILLEEFLRPMELSQLELARQMGVVLYCYTSGNIRYCILSNNPVNSKQLPM